MIVNLYLRTLAVAGLMLCAACCEGREPGDLDWREEPVAKLADATFRMEMDYGHCSATAVGPHTVLTASHCLADNRAIDLDGQLAQVESITHDGSDHAFIRVDLTFKHWARPAEICPGKDPASLYRGMPVFYRGNPGFLKDMLRRGYLAGRDFLPEADRTEPVLAREFTFYDVQGMGGDSGSGLFNGAGELVGMVSISTTSGTAPVIFMGSLPFDFSAEQWKQVQQ